ncbi:MAG: cyclase family protein [Candidatus Latescibacterota bacterium]
MARGWSFCLGMSLLGLAVACAPGAQQRRLMPQEVIDLGALVTPDLPEQFWGRALLTAMGFDQQNEFRVVPWSVGSGDARVSGQNSYYTLFNHGGPHVDAPNHFGFAEGLDGYPVESFVGPLKVFDVRDAGLGSTVGPEYFEGRVEPGDVVLIYTGYEPPAGDDLPSVRALSREAAEYLAQLPIRAFGTDAMSIDSAQGVAPADAPTARARLAPVHDAILSRGIPAYEQLLNLDRLVGRERLLFVGAPLNIQSGDGVPVRPVALVY